MLPRAARATTPNVPSSTWSPSFSQTVSRWPMMSASEIRRKSNRWHRLLTVSGSFCGSVVEKMNVTWDGGSSRVFSSALKAGSDSMWTSSM